MTTLPIRKLTEERFKKQMTGDQSYPLLVIATGTAGRDLRATRRGAGKAKKVIRAEGVGGKMTTPVTTDLVIEALAGPTVVTTASTRAGAGTGMMMIKTTNGAPELVDMTGIRPMASGATGNMMTVEMAIVTREMNVTAGHGALILIGIEETMLDTARRAGTGKGGTEMIDRLLYLVSFDLPLFH